jgi:hypothetical protein
MHPSDVTDLFAGQDVIILARYQGSGRATLNFEGTTADGPVRWSTRVDLPSNEIRNAFVSRLWATQRVGFLSAERRRNGGNPELDQEIRTLGERYSIPTMFTSYMVIEPGVQVGPDGRVINAASFVRDRSAAGGGGRAGGAGAQGGQAQQAQGQIGSQALALSGVVTTGLSDPAQGQRAPFKVSTAQSGQLQIAPTGPPLEALAGKVAGVQVRAMTSHESVRLDEFLRQSRSEAELDASLSSGSARRVGDRMFVLLDSTWVDNRYNDSIPVTKIKPFSAVYFELLKSLPALKPVFALGNSVLVAGKSVAIRLEETGVEQLSSAQLSAIVKKW